MEIRLELFEIVALQEIARGEAPKFPCGDLLRAGLIRETSRDYFITPFGKEILQKHLPYKWVSTFYGGVLNRYKNSYKTKKKAESKKVA